MRKLLLAGIAPLFLTAPMGLADITAEQVAGKELVAKSSSVMIAPDGSFAGTTDKGEPLAGTWQVKDGQWCRKVTAPARLAGASCQQAAIKGKTLTLTREDGSTVSLKIR